MALASGTRLGPYEILAPLGAGGMGEVYRARDTRLERTVAIKVLAHNVEDRAELFQRFEREAKTISTLNHPNICTLHDIGMEEGLPYLVMEYIEGETLSKRLMRGPLPVDQMWGIAIQVGDALDQAHRHGIVHRDLKPGNVMLAGAKGSSAVKLLDFGLAKIASVSRSAAAPGSLTSLPTVTVAQGLTVEGTIVGTVHYMSPEQLEGAEADARSDIFAFGCVLYEMVTGQKAFQGKSKATLISAILTGEPQPASSVQPMTPPALDRVVRKCLAKNPDDRWQTARDLVSELRWISENSSQTVVPVIPPRRGFRFQAGWIAATVLAAASAALLAMHLREPHSVDHTMRFPLSLPEKTSVGSYDTAVLSPDATHIVFSAEDDQGRPALYVRSLDSMDAKLIPGTSGWRYGYSPFWSPDSRFIAFFADQALKKIDLLGGNAITLCAAYGPTGGTWNRDGVILFSSFFNPIRRVSADGGNPTPAVKSTRGQGQVWPSFLPDGKHFLFTAIPTGGIYAGSLDSLDVKQVSSETSRAQYSSAGFLVFGRSGTVMAQPFDATRLRVTGGPIQIADRVKAVFGYAFFTPAFSAVGGALVYFSGSGGGGLTQLTWFDRKGGRVAVIGEAADYSNPALSPDGRKLAVDKRDPVSGNRDIWIFDLVRAIPRPLTFDPADDLNPLWSPDGQKIIFTSNRKGHRDLYQKASSGAGLEEALLESSEQKSCEDWTRDGRYVIYNRQIADKPREIWALPLFADRKPLLVVSGQDVTEGHVSPNGKWISYTSAESGIPEIYVQNFPPTGGKWRVSNGGGIESSWNANGKELFYLQGVKLMVVDVDTESGSFDGKGTPRMLFEAPIANPFRNAYLAATDGQRFLINTRVETKDTLPMTLVLNWPSALKH